MTRDIELLEDIISDVRQDIQGIRGGHVDGGPEIAFSTEYQQDEQVTALSDRVRQYILKKYDVSVSHAEPGDVITASGRAAPDFAFRIQA